MSTSAAVRRDMKDWVVFAQGERWTVKLDVRDLGGILTQLTGPGDAP